MKQKIIPCILILCLWVFFTGCDNMEQSHELELITTKDSGIKDFYIENETVYIVTAVTIRNHSSEKVTFRLNAESTEDYESGLLKFPGMTGYDSTLSTDLFFIEANSTETLEVVFAGERGNYDKKHDRLNPEISVEIIGFG